MLPSQLEWRDARSMLASVVETLSSLRGLQPAELLLELTSSLKDVIQVRLLGLEDK